MSQLGMDGTEVAHPVRQPPPLTARQREVMTYVRAFGVVTPTNIGVLMHQGRERPCMITLDFRRRHVSCCRYASSDGYDALRRLEQRGLVRRQRRGRWEAVTQSEDWL